MHEPATAPARVVALAPVRRRVVHLVLLLALLLALVAPSSSAPAAAATSTRDACTAVPDRGPFFDFHSSCVTHDACYAGYWYGRSDRGRYLCDVRFLGDMRRSCAPRPWYQRPPCVGLAYVYYGGVRLFGSPFFYSGDPLVRRAAPMG